MKRHEMWRYRYRQARDLDHLNAEELSERIHDCINNIRTRAAGGRVGLRSPTEKAGEAWMTLFTEVLEECALRGYEYPGPITIARFQSAFDHAFDPIPDMDQVIERYDLNRSPYLLKFGDLRWLSQAIEYGRFRIASASYYDSDEHNHARRDTELQRHTRLNPRSGRSRTPALPNEWSSVSAASDYYLFSMCEQYSSRLFGDFGANSCLVIVDRKKFLSKLQRVVSEQLPGWQIQVTRINYYDPVRVDPYKIVVPTFKPFRHAYQREMRLLCLPPKPMSKLPFIEVVLGPLDDCATLADLTKYPPLVLPRDRHDDPIQRFGTYSSEATMVNHLPDAAKVQGITLDKTAPRHEDWAFQIQYTDAAGNWHELKISMPDGLYLLNLLRTAEQEQNLSIWNRS